MGGLVLGIRVTGPEEAARESLPRRALRLFITERQRVYGDLPGYSYVLQEGPEPPAPDSLRRVGSTLALRRGEPVAITVVNLTSRTTTVHWHGLELESYYDGVGDWSGAGARVAPPIAPGDSFVVRLTPPRAGTFMYHTHTSEGVALASGLYGPLLVLPDRDVPDPSDRIALISIDGPLDDGRIMVNGSPEPAPIEVRAGTPHRFRLIGITPLETVTVQLLSGDSVVTWRSLAKDAADLPPHQAVPVRATLALHPGDTWDVEIVPEGVPLTLRIVTPGTVASRAAARAGGRPIARPVIDIPLVAR